VENFDYVKDIGALTLEQKRRFYVLFGHNLTVSVRAIWSDDTLSDSDKVEGMKWINEIMHHLIFRIEELHTITKLAVDSWTEEDFGKTIQHWVSQNYEIVAGHVGWAIKASYDCCVKNHDDGHDS